MGLSSRYTQPSWLLVGSLPSQRPSQTAQRELLWSMHYSSRDGPHSGSLRRRATPGLDFAIPFIESVAYRRSLKETTFPIHPQTAITRDNVHVQLDGAVYARVEDAYLASCE